MADTTYNKTYTEDTLNRSDVNTSGIPSQYSTLSDAGQTQTAGTVMENIQDPKIPESGIQTYTNLQDTQDQYQNLDSTSGSFMGQTAGATAGDMNYMAASTPADVTASTYEATKAAELTPQATAAQGTVSDAALAEAATAALKPEELVTGQLDGLLEALEGGNIPDWAKPAYDQVEAALAARGMSTSTIGRDSLFNAIIQAAMPLAQSNAQSLQQRSEANLQRQQQVNLQNAQAEYQMQMQNLSNEQQAVMYNTQSQLQTILSDQAAQNAAKQFNASSQTQVDTMMTQLKANVELQNSTQYNAMSQAQTTLDAQISQFNSQIAFNREQFNSQMYAQLEQSNVNWRRQMNTIDTAGQNAVNQANAINAFNLSNQALTWMWGDMRDSASWAFQAAENDQEYDLRMALAALSNEQATDKISLDTWKAVGSFISAVF